MDASIDKKLRASLAGRIDYDHRPGFRQVDAASAAVLVLWGRDPERPDSMGSILLTRRTETLANHKGQYAFPGGMTESSDVDRTATALRETWEEVGVPGEQVLVLGQMPELPTFTGFQVTPVVGRLVQSIDQVALNPDPREIALVFWAPVEDLTAPDVYRQEMLQVGSIRHPIPVFQLGEHRIWGATAAILRGLFKSLELF